MPVENILRPDAKGRIGLAGLARQLEDRFVGRAISGYSAEITPDGAILLRPRVEMDAELAATLLLDEADRDAFFAALADPRAPSEAWSAAVERHRRTAR